jgi:hypothetical protein
MFPVLGGGLSLASPSVGFATRAGWEVIENTILVDRYDLGCNGVSLASRVQFPAMPRPLYLLLLFVIVLLSAHASSRSDQFTPLVVSPLTTNTRPFHGTDGRVHLVYESPWRRRRTAFRPWLSFPTVRLSWLLPASSA